MRRIILASQSPRRRELIKLISEDVEAVPSGEDEILPDGIAVSDVSRYLALMKARSVSKSYPDDIVIGSDTIVVCDNEILSKPCNEADAERMLQKLSSRAHRVMTGCAIVCGKAERSFVETVEVEFYPLSQEDILGYIATGEPMDKAGAYGIQGRGALFVKGIRGDYYSVVGLPVARLKRELQDFIQTLDAEIFDT